MTEFVDPDAHVHRNYQQAPIVTAPDDVKPGNHTCKICNEKIKGLAYRRTTRFVGALEDRYGLERWQERGVALGLTKRQDLLLAASNAEGNDGKLDEICEKAKEAAGLNVKRELGTELHTLTERIDRGEDPPIPPSFKSEVEVYTLAMREFEIVSVEEFVVFDQFRVGGTTDRILRWRGQNIIGDVKTGSIDLSASKIAMQLAMYARSQRYNKNTGERSPLNVNTSRGVVIHLPPGQGRCDIKWADLDRAWQGIEIVRSVWDWRSEKGMLDASEPADLKGLIGLAGDRSSLLGLWGQHEHIWTDELTQLAQQRISELEGAQQ